MTRMDHEEYCAKCSGLGRSAMAKADFDELDEDQYEKAVEGIEDEEPDEDEDDEDEEKSLTLSPDEEELAKSMEYLQAMAESEAGAGNPHATRLSQLAEKAALEGLSKSEKAELAALADDDFSGGLPSDDLLKSESAREAFDASDFLRDQTETLAKSLDGLADNQRSFQTMQLEFNRRLARGLDGLSKSLFAERRKNERLVKSQNELLERIAGTPVPWKGRVNLSNADLAKGGRQSSGDLELLQKSSKIGRQTARDVISSLFDEAVRDEKEDLTKSLGNLLSNLNVAQGDWRQVAGMTPALVERITRSTVAG